MTTHRYIDADGHAWPITGATCQECGYPLTIITQDQTTHPLCQTGGELR